MGYAIKLMFAKALAEAAREALAMQSRTKLFLFAASAASFLYSAPALQAQQLSANPSSLAYVAQVAAAAPPQQTVAITGATGSNITVTASTTSGGSWIFVSPSSTTSPLTLTVFAITSGLQAGNYAGTITVTSSAPAIAPLNIPVTLLMSTNPLISASPSQLQFQYALSGVQPASQIVTLSSTGPVQFNYTAGVTTSSGGNWLSVSPAAGATQGQITVSVNTAALPIGTYTGSVNILAGGAANSPLSIPVTLTISPETTLIASPASFAFAFQIGTSNPPARALTISSTGIPISIGATVTIAGGGSWLNVTPSGTTPATLAVQVNTTSLAPGDYSATINITGAGATNSPLAIPVTLKVGTEPILQVSPTSANFYFQIGGNAPAPEVAVLSNLGNSLPLAVTTTTASGGNWLKATPTSTTTPAALLIEAIPTTLAAGVYTGNVVVAATGASNTPQNIPVTLRVSSTPLINVSPSNLGFAVQTGQPVPTPKLVRVSSTGSPLTFTVNTTTAVGGNWLNVTPATGTTGTDLSVSVNPATLIPGIYTGTISIQSSELGAAPQIINVTAEVSATPLLDVPQEPLRFSFATGGQQPANQSIQVNATSGNFSYTASAITSVGGNWLVVGPVNNTTGQPTAVGVNTLLPDGNYTGLVTIAASGVSNSPRYVPVTFSVSTVSALRAEPGPLRFTQIFGASAPEPQRLTISSTGGLLNITATVNTLTGGNWLSVSPQGGLTPAALNVSANGSQLAVGQYTGSIVVTSANATNSPLIIPITLDVVRAQNPIVANPTSLSFNFAAGGAAPPPQAISLSATTPVQFTITTTTASGGAWLTASPGSGNTPTNINVTVNPTTLAAGTYTGAVVVTSATATNSPFQIPVTLTVAAPVLNLTQFQNGASFQPTAAAPGLIVTLRGTGIGPNTGVSFQLTPQGAVPTTVGETRVLFDGLPAPVLFASATQVNAIVPYDVGPRVSTRVEVEYRGVKSNQLELRVAPTSPALFSTSTGVGQGAILNQDNSVNSAANPAARGSVVVLYGTGEGETTPRGVDGSVPRLASELKRPNANIRIRIGGQEVTPQYAGSAPGLVSGVIQINVPVPENIATGPAIPVEFFAGPNSSGTAITLAVR